MYIKEGKGEDSRGQKEIKKRVHGKIEREGLGERREGTGNEDKGYRIKKREQQSGVHNNQIKHSYL